MVFELITGDYMFNPKSGKNYGKEDDHIAYITELIGHPDKEWVMSGKRSRKFFTTKGRMKKIVKHKMWGLYDVFKTKYSFKEHEAKAISSFLEQALKWKSEDRLSAQEMLNHEWLSMPNDYDYKVESDGEGEDAEGEDGDEDANEEEDDSEGDMEFNNSGDEWETLETESDEDEDDDENDDSSFELVDHP
jgi:serine/threonine protein kinase